ncbi:MAG: hypothetical protein RIQ93_2422 [Verrucomicrobiota bacterium]|jgi:hypothetical protein
MSERLAELRRQRALVQEHLAWLNSEILSVENRIGAEDTKVAPSVKIVRLAPPRPPAAAPPDVAPAGAAVGPLAAAIYEEYKVPPETLRTDLRKGCLLYFAGALIVLALGLAVLFFALRRG